MGFMSRFTVTHHIVGTDTFRRAGQRSCHARAVLNSPVDCLKPRRHRWLVRAFCVAKSGWSAAEDSGVGYADHVAPKGNVSPPLMLFYQFSCVSEASAEEAALFRAIAQFDGVYVCIHRLQKFVYIGIHCIRDTFCSLFYAVWIHRLVYKNFIQCHVVYQCIHQAKSLFQSPAFAVAATDFQDTGSGQREPFKIDFIMLQTDVLLYKALR